MRHKVYDYGGVTVPKQLALTGEYTMVLVIEVFKNGMLAKTNLN